MNEKVIAASNAGAVVDLRVGERLLLDCGVAVILEHKSGKIARLRIVADSSIKIGFPSKVPAVAG